MPQKNSRWFLLVCSGNTFQYACRFLLFYFKVEIKQRWDINGPVHPDIDISLERYMPELKVKFGQVWGEHRCEKPGEPMHLMLSFIFK